MTEAVQIALIVAVPSTLAALPGLVVAVKTLRVSKANHVLANSKLSNVEKQLNTALLRIGALEEMLAHERGGRRRN